MNNKRILIVWLALTAIMAMICPCLALDSLLININQAAFISNPDANNDTRMLIQFILPAELDSSKYITYAELRFGVSSPREISRPINLKVNPITRQWSPEGLQWNEPWTNSRGDFKDSIAAVGIISQSGQSYGKIEVSHLLMQYVHGLLPNFGLIIRQIGVFRQALSPVPRDARNNLMAQLAIYYVDLDPED